jgi:hypothetical protein
MNDQRSVFSKSQNDEVKAKILRIVMPQDVASFRTPKYRDDGAADSDAPDAYVSWYEAKRQGKSDIWSLIAYETMPGVAEGDDIKIQSRQVIAGGCVFDVLYASADFVNTRESLLHSLVDEGDDAPVPLHDVAAKAGLPFDVDENLPVPVFGGVPLLPARLSPADYKLLSGSPAGQELVPVQGGDISHMFEKTNLPVTADTGDLVSETKNAVQHFRNEKALERAKGKKIAKIEKERRKQNERLRDLQRTMKFAVEKNFSSVARQELSPAALNTFGHYPFVAVQALNIAIGNFWAAGFIPLYLVLAEQNKEAARKKGKDPYYTIWQRPRKVFTRRLNRVRKDIKNTDLPELQKQEQLQLLDKMEVAFAALAARASFNKASFAGNPLSRGLSDLALKRDLKTLNEVAERTGFDEAELKTIIHNLQTIPPVKDIEDDYEFALKIRRQINDAFDSTQRFLRDDACAAKDRIYNGEDMKLLPAPEKRNAKSKDRAKSGKSSTSPAIPPKGPK